MDAFSPADVQATLAKLTARTIADALPKAVAEVLICGGGVHKQYLLERLSAQRPHVHFQSNEAARVDPNTVEAILFAWPACEWPAARSQDTGPITGAHRPVLLVSVHCA